MSGKLEFHKEKLEELKYFESKLKLDLIRIQKLIDIEQDYIMKIDFETNQTKDELL